MSFSQVKILPLGDSITRGFAGSYNSKGQHMTIGYRGPLFNSLISSGYNVDFVGTRSDGPPSIPYFGAPAYYDYDNEGHSGWQAIQPSSDPTYPQFDMLSRIDSFLISDQPDIVLMHLGTNDLESGQSPNGVVSDVNTLLNKIYSFNPNVVVFLAKIINRGLQVYSLDSSFYTYDSHSYSFNDPDAPANIRETTSNYNSLLGDMANERIINGNNIVLLNMETAITNYNEDSSAHSSYPYGELIDTFHPNQKGYNKMADVWFNALNYYFIGKPVLAGPSNNSKNLKTPITLTWGVTSNSVSYIVQISKDQNFTPDSLIYNNTITNGYNTINSNFKSSKTYYWRVGGQTSQGKTFYSDVWNFTAEPITIAAKVFLQGPYVDSDTMNISLNSSHYIPTTQPYNVDPWNYSGNENVTVIPSGVVDWVLLELRTGINSASTVAKRAAFIKNDGKIVDLDGISPVAISGITPGYYYLVLKHRNHLSVMSADTIFFSYSTTYDFTTSQSKAYGNNPMAELSGGKYGMFAGDNNEDKVISVSDYNLISNHLLQTGYKPEDVNMDGTVSYSDYNFVIGNLFKFTKVP
jgi:lysophospholipase L1-like esterase